MGWSVLDAVPPRQLVTFARCFTTHDGEFHADEVLATAVLSSLWPDAARVRTRDRATVTAASVDQRTLVYDIGGRHDPEMRIFDHHQADGPLRADGTRYSAFGLIWQTYGTDWLRHLGIDEGLLAATHDDLDGAFVKAIDQFDNGVLSTASLGPVGSLTLPVLLGDLVPEGGTPDEMTAAFDVAVSLARNILERRARQSAVVAAARHEVEAALASQAGNPILEPPRNLPFTGVVQGSAGAHVRFVVYLGLREWVLRAIDLPGPQRGLRHPLPAAWAGLEHGALADVCGVPDAIFCHRNRFIAVAGSREGILEMARQALATEP